MAFIEFYPLKAKNMQRILAFRNYDTGNITVGIHFNVESANPKFNKPFQEPYVLESTDKSTITNFIKNKVEVEVQNIDKVIITRDSETGDILCGVHYWEKPYYSPKNTLKPLSITLKQSEKTWFINFINTKLIPAFNNWLGL